MPNRTPRMPPEIDAEAARLASEVRAGLGRLYRRFRSQRASGDLGDTAMVVLTNLDDEGPLTLKALSDAHRVTPASMSQTVNRLTSAGYAVRSSDPDDGRRVLFAATPAGSALARASRARRHGWFQDRVAELGPEDRATLARAAVLLREIADDPRPDTAHRPDHTDERGHT